MISDFLNLIGKLLRREKVTIEIAYHNIDSLNWLYSQGRVLCSSKLRFGNSSMGVNTSDSICIAALKIFKDILCSRITKLQIINMRNTDNLNIALTSFLLGLALWEWKGL